MRLKEGENTMDYYSILSDPNTVTILKLYMNVFLLLFLTKRIIASKKYIHKMLLFGTKVPAEIDPPKSV